MKLAAAAFVVAATTLAAHATPAAALSMGPPDCHAFDRAVRQAANTAVIRILWVGETRRDGGAYVTPLRAVVDEVVNGRGVRRDQVFAWDERVEEGQAEFWGPGAPRYDVGTESIATIERDGRVSQWLPLDFYEDNLRTCYRRSLVSRAG